MRRCKLAILLYQFHRTTGRFDGRFGFFTYRIHFKSEFAGQFTIAQDLHLIILAYEPVDVKILKGELADIILARKLFGLAQVENFVFYPVGILESPLRNTALDRHLPAFMRHLVLETAAALVSFVSFRGCTSVAGSFPAS